jgi:hypothetical protein
LGAGHGSLDPRVVNKRGVRILRCALRTNRFTASSPRRARRATTTPGRSSRAFRARRDG